MSFPRKTVWLCLLMLALYAALCPQTNALADGLFGWQEREAPANHPYRIVIDKLWLPVLAKELSTPTFQGNGSSFGRIDSVSWRNLIKYSKQCNETELLHIVNGFFNQWQPQQDANTWATAEYWATPREFLRLRRGDCEDYAITKYFALRFLGMDASRLRIVIVRQKNGSGGYMKQLHAVLAVKRGQTWFILDNNARPRDNVFPQAQYRGHFVPLYSTNEEGAWVYGM